MFGHRLVDVQYALVGKPAGFQSLAQGLTRSVNIRIRAAAYINYFPVGRLTTSEIPREGYSHKDKGYEFASLRRIFSGKTFYKISDPAAAEY
jgi:hypothetical protein